MLKILQVYGGQGEWGVPPTHPERWPQKQVYNINGAVHWSSTSSWLRTLAGTECGLYKTEFQRRGWELCVHMVMETSLHFKITGSLCVDCTQI